VNKVRFASIIVTYRCNAKCIMCNTWLHPSKVSEEIGLDVYEKLPSMGTVNVTGGEPFLRKDLTDVVSVLKRKSKRVVISSNGYFTKRTVELFKRHPDIGLRVSIEGLPTANDKLRGIKDGFDHGIRTLTELSAMGVKDIGFGITVSDENADDLVELYHLAKMMNLEFATAAIHNSYYFHKFNNKFDQPDKAVAAFERLVDELLESNKPKDWFRAWFNFGLINYIQGGSRLLPCNMAHDSFFLDPFGEVLPCNVMNESMGNLVEQSWSEIWEGPRAEDVRAKVRSCDKTCWMMGSVAEPMKKNIAVPTAWVAKRKAASLLKKLKKKV